MDKMTKLIVAVIVALGAILGVKYYLGERSARQTADTVDTRIDAGASNIPDEMPEAMTAPPTEPETTPAETEETLTESADAESVSEEEPDDPDNEPDEAESDETDEADGEADDPEGEADDTESDPEAENDGTESEAADESAPETDSGDTDASDAESTEAAAADPSETAPAAAESESVPETTAAAVTAPAPAAPPVETPVDLSMIRGTLNGNVYTNTCFGIGSSMSADWLYLDRNMMDYMMGIEGDMIGQAGVFESVMASGAAYTDAYVLGPDRQHMVMYSLLDLNTVPGISSASAYIDAAYMSQAYKDSFASLGIAVDSIEKIQAEFAGALRDGIRIHGNQNGQNFTAQYMLICRDHYLMMVQFQSFGEDLNAAMAGCFYPLQ